MKTRSTKVPLQRKEEKQWALEAPSCPSQAPQPMTAGSRESSRSEMPCEVKESEFENSIINQPWPMNKIFNGKPRLN